MSDEVKKTWGGRRAGAGRKPGRVRQGVKYTIYLSEGDSQRLAEAAGMAGLTPYMWCKQVVLDALHRWLSKKKRL